MIEDLVALLDRNWSFLDAQNEYDFIAHTFPFFDELEREPRTRGILRDLEDEEAQSLEAVVCSVDNARTPLLDILSEMEREHPGAFPAEANKSGYDRRPAAIRRRLSTPVADPEPEAAGADEDEYEPVESDDDGRVSQAIGIMLAIANDQNLTSFRERITDIERTYEHAKRVRALAWRTSAGAAHARVVRELGDLHPGPNREPWMRALVRHARQRRGTTLAQPEHLFSQTDSGLRSALAMTPAFNRYRQDVRRIYEEIRRRLGAERSVRRVFDRYRQRCQWYEAATLRAMVDGRRNVEDILADNLALYLFDRGLNPLVRPLVGRLFPDLVDPLSPFSFYVEAKQYSESNRAYLRQGARQVWDMLGQLRGTRLEVREAFYVVFRLGGPRYQLPNRLTADGRVVFPILIDIAPSDQRGSRAEETIAISEAEWMPSTSDDD